MLFTFDVNALSPPPLTLLPLLPLLPSPLPPLLPSSLPPLLPPLPPLLPPLPPLLPSPSSQVQWHHVGVLFCVPVCLSTPHQVLW